MTNQADPDDQPPDGVEAEAQRESTIMPWLWGGVGFIVIAIFIAWAIFAKPFGGPPPAPVQSPIEGLGKH